MYFTFNIHPFLFTTGYAKNKVFHYWILFIDAIETEINRHNKENHQKIVIKTKARENKIIKSVQSFKRKQNPRGEIIKHKARICAYSRMQRWGKFYFEMCTPIMNQLSIQLLLTQSVAMNLDTCSINFIIAYS